MGRVSAWLAFWALSYDQTVALVLPRASIVLPRSLQRVQLAHSETALKTTSDKVPQPSAASRKLWHFINLTNGIGALTQQIFIRFCIQTLDLYSLWRWQQYIMLIRTFVIWCGYMLPRDIARARPGMQRSCHWCWHDEVAVEPLWGVWFWSSNSEHRPWCVWMFCHRF
jgi:hypothetical protein